MKQIQCEIYSRVSGFFRPVGGWNPGKKSEFDDRKTITQEGIQRAINKDIGHRLQYRNQEGI